MKRTIIYLLVTLFLVACDNSNNKNSIFKDRNVERAVRKSLNYNDGQKIQLKDLESITEVWCSDCTDLSGLKYLHNLKLLCLGGCKIDDFSELSELKSLKTLSLTNCKLTDIRFLNRLNTIEYLYLEVNRIKDISSIGSLKQLKELNVSHNYIKDISVLSKLPNIEIILMYNNLAEQLPDFSHCLNLKELYLQDNSLVCNKNFYNLKQVKEILLTANKIDNIDWVTSLDSVHVVDLGDNPINYKEAYKRVEMRNLIDKKILILDTDAQKKRSWWVRLINYCFD